MEKDDLFGEFRKNYTEYENNLLSLHLLQRGIGPGQSRGVLFKVSFQFLVTCLFGQVGLIHGLRRGRGSASPRHGQAPRHGVHTSQRSVFRQVVDESKSEM